MIGDIPRMVHQIWLQGTPPVQYLELCAGYERQQDFGWEYRLWDKVSIDRLVEAEYPQYLELWRSLSKLGQMADLARCLLLH
jgi:mannosyltransferase OCH1-like enzyme